MTRQLRNEFKNFADFSDGAATAFVRRRVSVEQHFNAHCKGLSHSGENVGARGLRGKRSQIGLQGRVASDNILHSNMKTIFIKLGSLKKAKSDNSKLGFRFSFGGEKVRDIIGFDEDGTSANIAKRFAALIKKIIHYSILPTAATAVSYTSLR